MASRFPESAHDFAGLHQNQTFQAVFSEPSSPVHQEIAALHTRLLSDHRMPETERLYLQGKLAGIRSVAMLIEAVFNRTSDEHVAGSTPRPEVRAELRLLPPSLRGTSRTFPGFRRAVQGGK